MAQTDAMAVMALPDSGENVDLKVPKGQVGAMVHQEKMVPPVHKAKLVRKDLRDSPEKTVTMVHQKKMVMMARMVPLVPPVLRASVGRQGNSLRVALKKLRKSSNGLLVLPVLPAPKDHKGHLAKMARLVPKGPGESQVQRGTVAVEVKMDMKGEMVLMDETVPQVHNTTIQALQDHAGRRVKTQGHTQTQERHLKPLQLFLLLFLLR